MPLHLDFVKSFEGSTQWEVLAQILDDYPEGVQMLNVQTVLVYYNRAQGIIDDLTPEQVLGKSFLEIYRYRANDYNSDISLRCLFTRKALINQPCWYRTNQGNKLINAICSVFPLFTRGRLAGSICFTSEYSRLSNRLGLSSGLKVKPPEVARPGKKSDTQYTFDNIITQDPLLRRSLSIAARSADSSSSVMLYGETGCGKDMIAQAIHNFSDRRSMPFLVLNCAAVPESLLEGILFGTTKGAFTGAIDKQGLLEMADGGTIFLDEINSMPLNLQNKLLRVIQEKKNRRIGSASEKPVSLKIISASNIHPQEAVAAGHLRADLFFRLAVVLVGIPPLRERPGDLLLLTRHFISKFNQIFQKNIVSLSSVVEKIFQQYHWPGNVRELEHALEGALLLVSEQENTLEPDHFNATLMSRALSSLNARETTPILCDPASLMPEALSTRGLSSAKTYETSLLIAALEAANGNVALAARTLNISPQLLNYKMKKFGLKKEVSIRSGLERIRK